VWACEQSGFLFRPNLSVTPRDCDTVPAGSEQPPVEAGGITIHPITVVAGGQAQPPQRLALHGAGENRLTPALLFRQSQPRLTAGTPGRIPSLRPSGNVRRTRPRSAKFTSPGCRPPWTAPGCARPSLHAGWLRTPASS
jgi:hypothetical protein